jgi:hypothetical protein
MPKEKEEGDKKEEKKDEKEKGPNGGGPAPVCYVFVHVARFFPLLTTIHPYHITPTCLHRCIALECVLNGGSIHRPPLCAHIDGRRIRVCY